MKKPVAMFALVAALVVAPAALTSENRTDSPVATIQTTIIQLNKLTQAVNYSPQIVHSIVDNEVLPLFDFDYIADEVLLILGVRMSPRERDFFAGRLRKNIARTLLSKLTQSSAASFRFVSARPLVGDAVSVQLMVHGFGAYPLYLDLYLHQNPAGNWQIFDVVLNQDSLVGYYQRMVMTKVRRYGIYGMLGRI